MPTLPTLGHQMFLSEKIDVYVNHVNKEHAPCLSYAKHLNEIGHRALFNVRITRTNLQHVLLATLLQRGLKTFQATIILLERGLPEEGLVALRSLLEVTFRTVAIAKEPSAAEAFVQEDEEHRIKLINKYKLLSAETQDPQVMLDLDRLLVQCQNRLDVRGKQKLGTYWFADKAGMLASITPLMRY